MQLNRMESSNSKEETSLNVSNVFHVTRKKWINYTVYAKSYRVTDILFSYLENKIFE